MKGEANVNPTESVAYRKSLLEKGRKEMTMEEKEWLECNPVYVIKNDKLYYKRDILELPRNCKCKLTVECVHSESAYPTVPTLSIPNGYNGYITVNAEKYPQIPNLSTKKSSKLSIRIAEKYPGHLFCESNTGFFVSKLDSSRIKNVALVGKYSFSGFGNDADRNRAKQDSICL
mgnify:CR=1 FL=1